MHTKLWVRLKLVALCTVFIAPAAGAQTLGGQARAAQVTTEGLLGTTTSVVSDTGTLEGASDSRQASQLTATIAGVLSAATVHAVTLGWPDQVASEASLADLVVNVAESRITADFVMSRATAAQGAAASGIVSIEGLLINGLPISVTGAPNQTVAIPGGQVVINEQQNSATSSLTNALHIVVNGVIDVVVGSATASIQ